MIIPTLGCQCNCKYCWGSESTKEMNDISVIDDIITWLKDFRDDKFILHSTEETSSLQAMISMLKL